MVTSTLPSMSFWKSNAVVAPDANEKPGIFKSEKRVTRGGVRKSVREGRCSRCVALFEHT